MIILEAKTSVNIFKILQLLYFQKELLLSIGRKTQNVHPAREKSYFYNNITTKFHFYHLFIYIMISIRSYCLLEAIDSV